MKKIPSVLIVGRPNVGKSTLINRILKARKAITHDEPGVTRDLASFLVRWHGCHFEIVDSGGVLFGKNKDIYLQDQIEQHVKKAAEKARF